MINRETELEKSRNVDIALKAIKVINDFTWKAAELAIQANTTKSLSYYFKLLKSSNNVILNSAIHVARELSNGNRSTTLSGLLPEVEKSLFKDMVLTEAVKQSAVILGKIGSKMFGSLLSEILFSDPLNPVESAGIKIATNKRIDSMHHACYKALMLQSLEKAKAANAIKATPTPVKQPVSPPVANVVAKPTLVAVKPPVVTKPAVPVIAKPVPVPVKPPGNHVGLITRKPIVPTKSIIQPKAQPKTFPPPVKKSVFITKTPVIQPKAQAKPAARKLVAKAPANPLTTEHANWVRQTALNTANTSAWIQKELQKQSQVSQQKFNDERKQCTAVQQNIIETKKKQLAELQRNASNHHGGVAYHGPVGVGPQTLSCMHTINAATRQVAAPVYCRPAGSNANFTFYSNQNAVQACHPQASMNFVRKF